MSTEKNRPEKSRDRRPNDNSIADSSNRNPDRSRRSRSRSQKRRAKSPVDRQSSIKRPKIPDDAAAKQRDRSYTPKKNYRNRSPIPSTKGRRISPSSSTQTRRDDRRRDSSSPAKKSGRYQRSPSPKKSNHLDSSSGADKRYPQQRRSPSSNARRDKKYDRQRSRSRSLNRTNRRSRTPKENDSRKRTNTPRSSNRRRSTSQSRTQRKRSPSSKPGQRKRSRSRSRNRSLSKSQNGNHSSPSRHKRSNSRDRTDRRNQFGNFGRNHLSPSATVVAPTHPLSSPNRNDVKAKASDKSTIIKNVDTRARRNSSRSQSRSRSPRQASRPRSSPKGRSPHRDRNASDKNDTVKSSDNQRASRREDFLRSPKRKSTAVPPAQLLPAVTSQKASTKRRAHSSDSNASSLSYSPARKNPERYKEILDRKDSRKAYPPSSPAAAASVLASTTPNDKSRTPPEQRAAKSSRSQSRDHSKRKPTPQHPVVRLHTSTDSDDDNVDTSRLDKYEEIINTIRKDDEILKALSGIAAKAKEKIKTMSEPAAIGTGAGGSVGVISKSPDAFLSREMAIASVSMASGTIGVNILNDDVASKVKTVDNSLKINEFKIKGRKDITDQCNQMTEQSSCNNADGRSRSKSTGVDAKDVKKSKKHRSSSRSRYVAQNYGQCVCFFERFI